MQAIQSSEKQVRNVRLACLALAVFVVVAAWAHWPYLSVECRRIKPWMMIGLWSGDVFALFWFLRFAFTHAVAGEPLSSVSAKDARRQARQLVIMGLIALAADLGFSLYLMWDEHQTYAKAVPTKAEVAQVQVIKRPEYTWYELDFRFKANDGAYHEAHMRVGAKAHILPGNLPIEAQALLSGQETNQSLIPIRYDSEFPSRAWIEGTGWEDENGIYWFSVGVLLVQGVLTLIFFLFLKAYSIRGILPWWWDIYKVIPIVAEAFLMLMGGLIDRFMDAIM